MTTRIPTVFLFLLISGCSSRLTSSTELNATSDGAAVKECSQGVRVVGSVRDKKGQTLEATVAAILAWEENATSLVTTSADGNFEMCLDDGEFAITVTADGFSAAYQEPSSMSSLGKAPMQFILEPAKASIEVVLSGALSSSSGSYIRSTRLGDSM